MLDVEEEVFGAQHEEGAYECTLRSIGEKKASEQFPGNYYRIWAFTVVDDDSELSAAVSDSMHPKSKAYQFATALCGGKKPTGMKLIDLLGRKVTVIIDEDEKITGLHPIVKAKPKTLTEAFDGDDPR